MIKNIIFITAFLFSQFLLSQQAEPIYYDKNWEVTSKSNASFYRKMPLKELGELVLIQDYFINGTLQFEGYAFKTKDDSYVGDVIWYDKNGNDESFRQYKNETKNATLSYYHSNGKLRKKVQYKNGVKDGETIIYAFDETVLMTGMYKKGKPESGSFENVTEGNDYDFSERIEEVSDSPVMVRPIPPPPLPPAPRKSGEDVDQTEEILAPNNNQDSSDKKFKNRKTVTQKIFWINSKQIAQETVYEVDEYGVEPIAQKNYDKSGKLIQSLNKAHFKDYGKAIKTGIEYEYYLQNNFATEIKSSSNYINGDKSGKEISCYPNGNRAFETNFKDGLKEGEEIVFNETGTVKMKRSFKANDPFNGNFDERVGDAFVNINYSNGVKEGEAIAKNEQGEIIAKGIYKTGKPFNGTFFVENEGHSDHFELINVESFKKDGLQKVYNYSLQNLEKTYTIQNGMLNGLTTFYNEGQVAGTLEYKNDDPYSGTLLESEKTSVYKNGRIVEETFFEDQYNKDKIQKQKFYENGILSKVKNYSFAISEKPQEFYEGILKSGKPFSGYFETEDDREFKQVNYFENGILKFQYSNDYLKNMDNYRHQYYDVKSTYKDGKVFDGVEYHLGKKQFTSRYWKNGVLKSFDWDLFAMHYFNRIHFELKNNTIEISDMQKEKSAAINIDISKNGFSKQLSIDGKLVDSTRKEYLESKYKEGLIIYREQDGKIITTKIDQANESVEPSEGTELFYKVYMIVRESSAIQQSFNDLSEKFVSNKFMEETDENEIITGHQTDADGKPKEGILITPTQNNTYTLQLFMNRKLIKSVEKVIFSNVKDEIKKLEKLD